MESMNKNFNGIDECKVRISNYDEYVKINGMEQAICPQALEVRDNNASYYVIEKNGEFFCDFCIFLNENRITLDKTLFLNDDVINNVISTIKDKFEYVSFYVPIEQKEILKSIQKKYSKVEIATVKKGDFEFSKIKLFL